MCIKALKICTEFQSHLPSLYQCMKINPIFNSRPITMQDFEFWIDFSALIRWRILTFKIDISLTKRQLNNEVLLSMCNTTTYLWFCWIYSRQKSSELIYVIGVLRRLRRIRSLMRRRLFTLGHVQTRSEKIVKWLDLIIAPCNLTRKIGA